MFNFQRLLFRRNEWQSQIDSAAAPQREQLPPPRARAGQVSPSPFARHSPQAPLNDPLQQAIERGTEQLLSSQQEDGHWCYELEADCTINAEYILMMHWLGEDACGYQQPNSPWPKLEQRLARYIIERQQSHGGWELYPGAGFHISVSVKAYYALKLAGYSAQDPRMQKARHAILAHGGAARCNVFTRIVLAQFNQVPWRAIPVIPAEIILLPPWFFFSLKRIAYWSRTVLIPLTIQYSKRARAQNPKQVSVPELFTTPPFEETEYFTVRSPLNRLFLLLERFGRQVEPWLPKPVRHLALRRAERWMLKRLNGEDGLGAIFPAMTNSLQALHCLGYPQHHPLCQMIHRALNKLLVHSEDKQESYCQPCLSPVWDTAWACVVLREVAGGGLCEKQLAGLDWLKERQITASRGDWQKSQPKLPGGGWAFQYRNDYYPDLDDTAVVAWAMHLIAPIRYRPTISRATRWVEGMQSQDGGFAAFDQDNTSHYLNEIPFADHGALLDPPTADVTARCLMHLATQDPFSKHCFRALRYLANQQEQRGERAGAWYGRWGTNYIYGTWSTLQALEYWRITARQLKNPAPAPFPDVTAMSARAVAWLHRTQRADGGWGESNDSYYRPQLAGQAGHSMSVQTAWALLGLLAAGEHDSPSVRAGIRFLLDQQDSSGRWHDPTFNAPGFPRVFHLNYHGYGSFFPLWALARYRNLNSSLSSK